MGEGWASSSDTIPLWLVWICWLPYEDGKEVGIRLEVWIIEPENKQKGNYINTSYIHNWHQPLGEKFLEQFESDYKTFT